VTDSSGKIIMNFLEDSMSILFTEGLEEDNDENLREEIIKSKLRPSKSWLSRKRISRYEMDDLFDSKET
jgi:hypothetical protein